MVCLPYLEYLFCSRSSLFLKEFIFIYSSTSFLSFVVSHVLAGRLMLVSPWQPVIGDKHQILTVTPIAVACSSTANFSVKGFNIVQPTTK